MYERRPLVHIIIYARRDRRRKIFVYDTRVMIQSIFIFPSVVGGDGVGRFIQIQARVHAHSHIHTYIYIYIISEKESTMKKKKNVIIINGEEKKNPRQWR